MRNNLLLAIQQLDNSDKILLLAGAGMSADLNIPTWRGNKHSVYDSSALTPWGLTTLDHYRAKTFKTHGKEQRAYHAGVRKGFADIDFLESHYTTLLRRIGEKLQGTLTTNIDSGFIRSNYPLDTTLELHGSYQFEQCPTGHHIWLTGQYRYCPTCFGPARPNVMFFEDHHYSMRPENFRAHQTIHRHAENGIDTFLVIGAGLTVLTLYHYVQRLAEQSSTVIIVNPDTSMIELTSDYPNMLCVNLSAKDFVHELDNYYKRKEG